jgi:hypothetical protein
MQIARHPDLSIRHHDAVCHAPVLAGQQIARLIRPAGWCHLTCVPIVAALQAATTTTGGKRP